MTRLASSKWLSHIKEVLNTSCLAAQCLEKVAAPVLLTEASGMDMSLLVTSLAQIILNPDTRPLHGLQAWLYILTNANRGVDRKDKENFPFGGIFST